jgi:hypothetical protein
VTDTCFVPRTCTRSGFCACVDPVSTTSLAKIVCDASMASREKSFLLRKLYHAKSCVSDLSYDPVLPRIYWCPNWIRGGGGGRGGIRDEGGDVATASVEGLLPPPPSISRG